MAIDKKVAAWVQAGLISADQGTAIRDFESQGGRNWVLFGFGSVGIVAVATGVVSLIAANWAEIPVAVKLAGYFAAQLALALAALRFAERDGFAREALLALFGLGFFAGIGLVAQIYNLGSDGWQGVLFWCALALPAALLARSRLLPQLWMAGLTLAVLLWSWSSPGSGETAFDRTFAAIGIALAVTALGLFRGPSVELPEPLRRAAWLWGLGTSIAVSIFAAVVWSMRSLPTGWHPGWALVFPWLGALLAVAALLASRPAPPPAARAAATGAFLLLAAYVTAPPALDFGEQKILGCLVFMLLWGLAAVAAGTSGHKRFFDLATFAIAARLVIVYFEVFGSLSATGFGLIFSGLLILGAAFTWHRYRRRLAGWLGATDMKTVPWKVYLALFAPVAVLLGWTAYHATVAATGTKVRLAVTGYDPRDLLSGHYLRYQVDYGAPALCERLYNQEACVCLGDPLPGRPATAEWSGSCAERPRCRSWLRGRCTWSRFEAGIERYYFPENLAKPLATVPPNATIEVSLDGDGRGLVTGFFVGDEPLLDYARRRR